jgi:glycerol-3-phosphate dehydrogenase subunit B
MLSLGMARVKALPRAFRAAYFAAMLRADVLVIGGGVAGAAAAIAAARGGASVTLVRRGPGASALASGGWLGEPPADFRTALAAAGMELHAVPAPLPCADGSARACGLAPATHADAALAGDASTLVCGIAGLPGFRPAALARLWIASPRQAPAAVQAAVPPPLSTASITLRGTPAAGWSAASLASSLERDPDLILAPLLRARDAAGCGRVILPAVLGLGDHSRVREAFSAAGVAGGEAVGGTPSVPGWRLDGVLLAALRQAGVTVITGRARVEPGGSRGGYTISVAVPSRPGTSLAARAVVLATGSFVGGGIKAKPELTETASGLAAWAAAAGRQFRDPRDSLLLTTQDRTGPQTLLTAAASDDDVAAAGLLAAGALRGNANGRDGLGYAAADGWRAGLAAVERI